MRAGQWFGAAILLVLCAAGVVRGASSTTNGAEPIRIAVTVDDLPAHGELAPGSTRIAVARAVLHALHDNRITQAYGFSNGYMEKWEPGVNRIMKLWLAAGYPVGNHTYDHADLDNLSARAYIANIAKMDRLLETVSIGTPLIQSRHVFRYPYLKEGDTLQKRDAVRSYLFRNGYRIAEVTIDYNDWAWNNAYVRCVKQDDQKSISWLKTHVVEDAELHLSTSIAMAELLFHRRVAQILLVHVGVFDAVMLDTILKSFQSKSVRFITLDEALSDPVYRIDPDYVSSAGKPFFEQIAAVRHVDIMRFSDQLAQGYPYAVERLEQICLNNRTPISQAKQRSRLVTGAEQIRGQAASTKRRALKNTCLIMAE